MPFFLIFILIPFVEISVFISVGGEIGLFNTLALSLLTAIIGGSIFRYQGLKTFHQAMYSMNRAELPVKELFDGFCLVIAAAMLVTPGFVTDTLGFLLLVPVFRDALRRFVSRHMKVDVHGGSFYHGQGNHPYSPSDKYQDRKNGGAIEGEYEKLDETEEKD